ncbi:serine/threonine-protein kinase pakG-like [Chenopodium quinoa]|uniref:Uncharacterized protein n=1 Tax=Chenopodium quinoa TaxID=63459 RepID=A0A803L747_CHEQI|nr:serine/threonine-protein kinase pakG-like [Chenopodium quinoa]
MGSCISKCKSKKNSKKKQSQQEEECKCQCIEKNNNNNTCTNFTPLVQDKLVISQAPISPSSPPKTSSSSAKSSCANSYYPATTTSSSSSSCSMLSSASSVTSASSSVISSKLDQSFTNDFLWSCVKENPQILNGDYHPIKVVNPRRNSLPIKKSNRPKELHGPTPSPQRVLVRPAPQKRPRCNSPSNLTRQKSFRREPEVEPNRPVSRSGRDLRPISPSPSRRFNGEGNNQGKNLTSSMRRENCHVRPPSPISKGYNSNSRRNGRSNAANNLLVKKENEDMINGVNTKIKENEEMIRGVNTKIKEIAMGGLVSSQDMDMMPIEDVENPHIALDCFIFL